MAATQLGVTQLDALQAEHVPFLVNAAFVALMRETPVPESQWFSEDKRAKKARRSVGKRCSEFSSFLSWADHENYIWAARLNSTLMSRPWAEFVALTIRRTWEEKSARELAAKARPWVPTRRKIWSRSASTRLSKRSLSDSRYANRRARRVRLVVVGRLEREGRRHGPSAGLGIGSKDEAAGDGGLDLTWWSATAVVNDRPSILDKPGMEFQRKQAYAVRDWWTAFDPTLRNDADGEALPPRPLKEGRYVKQLGSRDENPRVAQIPLSAVSRLQRFALSEDEEQFRISHRDMEAMAWPDLFRDRARMARFAEHEYARNDRKYGGKISRGAIWQRTSYCYTIMWAYFPAYLHVTQDEAAEALE